MAVDKKSSLKTRDICTIIEACASSGVSELKYGPLHIHFEKLPLKEAPNESHQSQGAQNTFPGIEIPADEIKKIELDNIERQESVLRDEEVANLILQDPMRFEELLRNGELEDDEEPGSNQ